MSVFNNNLLLGAGGQSTGPAPFDPTLIPNSVWLDGSADLLSKSFSGSASATEGVYSMWVQRTGYGTDDGIFGTYGTIDSATKELMFAFQESNKIQIYWFQGGGPGLVLNYITTRVFRDIGWYHILFSYKTDESGAGDRAKLFINGIEETAYDTKTNPSASYAPPRPFASVPFGIGVTGETGAINSDFLDGYIAQSTFLDGHSIQGGDVAITDFLDTFTYGTNGSQFVPKANSDVAGLASAAGANSFCLDFANSSDLGNDISSKGNDFSLTSMAAANQSTHTPSLTYLQFNPLQKFGTAALSEGNTRVGVDVYDAIRGTKFVSTGKKYLEITVNTVNNTYIGVANGSSNPSSFASSNVACLQKSGDIYINDSIPSGQSARSKAVATGDVIGILIDADAKKFWQSVNGTINSLDRNNSITVSDSDVLAGTGGFDLSGLTGDDGNYTIHIGNSDGTSADVSINGGHKDFSHTPPTGYLGWGSDNYTAPEFQGKDYFDSTLYEGNGLGQRVGDFVPFTDAHTINNSAMFNEADERSFRRTPSSAGNQKTWTFSTWIKRTQSGADYSLLNVTNSKEVQILLHNSPTGSIEVFFWNGSATDADIVTAGGFEDMSNWHNIVVAVDTRSNGNGGPASANDRIIVYVDGVRQTLSTSDNPSDDYDTILNTATEHTIGQKPNGADDFQGYLSDTVLIDGSQLTASSFGQVDTSTNRWVPKDVSGLTFGTNGFYLKYENSPVNVALGKTGLKSDDLGTGAVSLLTDGTQYGSFNAGSNLIFQNSNVTTKSWWGVDFGSGQTKTIKSATLFGNQPGDGSAAGFIFTSGAVTWTLFGSNSAVATSSNDLSGTTTLGTAAVADGVTKGAAVTIDASSNTTAFRFFYVQMNTTLSTRRLLGEIQLYETAGGGITNDSSGQNNDLVAAGAWAATDQFIDTPSKNFTTFDPGYSGGGSNVWTEGNTKVKGTDGTNADSSTTTFGMTGKVVFQFQINALDGDGRNEYPIVGFITSQSGLAAINATGSITIEGIAGAFSYTSLGRLRSPASTESTVFVSTAGLQALDADDVLRFEVDTDAGTVRVFFQNEGSGSFSEITGARVDNFSFDPSFGIRPAVSGFSNSIVTLQTGGQTTLASVTTGFLELNQDNLDDTQSKLTAWAWIKNRDAADNHMLFDRIRGVGNDLHSNDPAAEAFNAKTVQRFLQRGVEVGSDVEVNTALESYVLWQWLLGDSATTGSTNDDGSVDTTVIAADAGHFSIVKGTTGGSGATFGHGLGAAPDFIINKDLTSAGWLVYSSAFASVDNYIQLNATSSVFTGSTVFGTAPTSTVFTLASFFNTVECINYCFRSVPGVCKVGGYIGNGSADGPYVSLGFTPRWVMIKKTSGTGSWNLYDTARSPINEVDDQLLADSTAAETTGSEELDIIADGFKIRTADSGVNTSSGTYIYLAMADIGGNGTLPPIYSR